MTVSSPMKTSVRAWNSREVGTRVIPVAKTRPLGTVRGREFIAIEGRGGEYELLRGHIADPRDFVMQPGEVIIGERVVEDIGGSPLESTRHRRALPVPPGTFGRMVAEDPAGKARDAAPRPVDQLARHAFLQGTPDRFMPVGPQSATYTDPTRAAIALELETEEAAVRANAGIRATRDRSLLISGRRPIRGGQAIREALEAKGIALSLTPGGRLLAQAPRGIDPAVLEVIRDCERLIVGALTGVPLRCELAHDGPAPEAATVVAVGILACSAHGEA